MKPRLTAGTFPAPIGIYRLEFFGMIALSDRRQSRHTERVVDGLVEISRVSSSRRIHPRLRPPKGFGRHAFQAARLARVDAVFDRRFGLKPSRLRDFPPPDSVPLTRPRGRWVRRVRRFLAPTASRSRVDCRWLGRRCHRAPAPLPIAAFTPNSTSRRQLGALGDAAAVAGAGATAVGVCLACSTPTVSRR